MYGCGCIAPTVEKLSTVCILAKMAARWTFQMVQLYQNSQMGQRKGHRHPKVGSDLDYNMKCNWSLGPILIDKQRPKLELSETGRA